jgi:hypothetical protein
LRAWPPRTSRCRWGTSAPALDWIEAALPQLGVKACGDERQLCVAGQLKVF